MGINSDSHNFFFIIKIFIKTKAGENRAVRKQVKVQMEGGTEQPADHTRGPSLTPPAHPQGRSLTPLSLLTANLGDGWGPAVTLWGGATPSITHSWLAVSQSVSLPPFPNK